ncbi:early protein 7 [Callithrix penicillata papillomavirus type 2]|uniref:Protein E7 n=1 Tax=Callithrix penicillata papillomavirus type 2 TaxID=2704504 RepID=A0A6C0TAW1_9PAPI|nr:early protein 7 [Callithrix penicillata papillomavirus type 2]
MRGDTPNIQGVELDLHELVLPHNLLSGETLSSDEEEVEEESSEPFRVATPCGICQQPVRFFILADETALRALQELLVSTLQIVCLACAREETRNGR